MIIFTPYFPNFLFKLFHTNFDSSLLITLIQFDPFYLLVFYRLFYRHSVYSFQQAYVYHFAQDSRFIDLVEVKLITLSSTGQKRKQPVFNVCYYHIIHCCLAFIFLVKGFHLLAFTKESFVFSPTFMLIHPFILLWFQ